MKRNPNSKPTSLFEFMEMFPDSEAALSWLERVRWGGEPRCARCGSVKVHALPNRSGFRQCNACRKQFSVRTGSVLQSTKLPLAKWMFAFYLMATARKGVSSIQLGKMLGVTQKTAWHMQHRIRAAMGGGRDGWLLEGVIECDETFIGGKEKNKHADKRLHQGRGCAGKIPLFGAVERRKGGRAFMAVAADTSKRVLQRLVRRAAAKGSTVCTDEARAYEGLHRHGYRHLSVCHGIRQWRNGEACTNKAEGMWSVLKRGYCGTYHSMSRKHLQRYADEFSFRYNEGAAGSSAIGSVWNAAKGGFGRTMSWRALAGG
jgi:transposase-like protein